MIPMSSISDPRHLEHSRVMVLDDHPSNVALLRRLLRLAGVGTVEGFTDATVALERCREALPDLLLLDLHMPGMDGFAVMALLRSTLPVHAFLPVLVLTGDDNSEIKKQALAAGAKDFLTKPFDPTEVLLRVHNLLETKDLYTTLERHNARLQAELDEQLARDRQAGEDYDRRVRRIDHVLRKHVVEMVFQPIVSLSDGRLVGAEALARFNCEPRRPPNEWFAEAAVVGRGVELELQAVAAALAQLDQLPAGVYMSVNASPMAALDPALGDLLARHPGDRVVLELTEHTRVQDYDTLLDALEGPRRDGVRIAVDDTGAGYAGLQHLLRLRPNVLKLDIGLTRDIDKDPARRALGAALVMFANEIGAILVAEGVDSVGELHALQALGIPAVQGFHLARPGPMSDLRPEYGRAFDDGPG
jgi:EAL domain-containing protein (putative c-di-GMP-specific phosphodiesterase class I)